MDSFAGRTYWWKGIPIAAVTCLLIFRKKIGEKHRLMQKGIRKHRELIDHILHTAIKHFVVTIQKKHFVVKIANFSNKLINLQNRVT